MADKPVVRYTYATMYQGKALVETLDHPSDMVSNQTVAITSTVLKWDEETGVFETENTVYVPHNKGDLR